MEKYDITNPLYNKTSEYESPHNSSSGSLFSTNTYNSSNSVFQTPFLPSIEVTFSNKSSTPSYSSYTSSNQFCNSPYLFPSNASFSPMNMSNTFLPPLPLFSFAPLPPPPPPFLNLPTPISSDKSNVTFVINVPKDANGLVVIPNKWNKKKGHNFIFTRKDDDSMENDGSIKKEINLDIKPKEEFGLNSSSDMNLKYTDNAKEIVPLLDFSCELISHKHKPSKLSNY